jgi:hypothetical protein
MSTQALAAMMLATAVFSAAGCKRDDGSARRGAGEGSAMDSSQKSAAADLLRMFRDHETEFRREPVELALWQHGGGPGPGFTSDQLVLTLNPDHTARATYTRTRFDRSYEPPFLAEKFTGTVSKERAEDILRRALGGPLFENDHAAERDPRIGGVMKEEWDLTRGKVRAHKTFFKEPFPADYAQVREACAALMAELTKHGTREVVNKKRGGK